jgi:hypothetical protein
MKNESLDKVQRAHVLGMRIQTRIAAVQNDWNDAKDPLWLDVVEYRIHPDDVDKFNAVTNYRTPNWTRADEFVKGVLDMFVPTSDKDVNDAVQKFWSKEAPKMISAHTQHMEDIQPRKTEIDFTKPVEDGQGRAVRILCTDGPGKRPIVGMFDDGTVCKWLPGGMMSRFRQPDDLRNVAPKKEWWMNVSADGYTGPSYPEKRMAMKHMRAEHCGQVRLTFIGEKLVDSNIEPKE